MTGLVLLVGVLWVFGGLQSEALAQDGEKFCNPRALERLESLVASLNESLHETKEDLQEMRLCLNQTKKTLGEVQREKESLEAALLKTRTELASTKSLHQQAIDELRASQDRSRVEALERKGSKLEKGLKRVRRKVSAIENEHLPRQLNELSVQVTRHGQSINQLSGRVTDQGERLNTLASTVEEQGTCIASLKEDVNNYIIKRALAISFEPIEYTVREKERTVNLTITASKPTDILYTVSIVTSDGTAFANSDYEPGPYKIEFAPGTTSVNQPVYIVDNNVVEGPEFFYCTLTISDDLMAMGVQVDQSVARVNITDNDVEVEFAADVYVAEENDMGGISITLVARGDLSSEFTIPVTVIGGTAMRGADYLFQPDNVTFPISASSVNFSFMANCDELEESENAVLSISVHPQDQHRITIGDTPTTEVFIIDDKNCMSTPTGQLRSINDTVMSNPVFTVPILNTTNSIPQNSTVGFPMCYEVHGQEDTYFNLVSDNCTSVNAYYVAAETPQHNVIKEIGVVATDSNNMCHYVRIEVSDDGRCVAELDGRGLVNSGTVIMDFSVNHKNNLVRISVPNCSPPKQRLVMWVHCQKLLVGNHEQTMIKYIINRGLTDHPMAHGLIGQFWGVPFKMVPTNAGYFNLTMHPPPPAKNRTMFAQVSGSTWTQGHVPAIPNRQCLFVGNRQAGSYLASYDSVIEGTWRNYITDGLFETNWTYTRYTALACGKSGEK